MNNVIELRRMLVDTVVLVDVGADEPGVDVLRRTDVGSRFVHGAEHRPGAEESGVDRQNGHLHHPPAVVGSVRHVRPSPAHGRRQDRLSGPR